MNRSTSPQVLQGSLVSRLIDGPSPARLVTLAQAEEAMDRGLAMMYRDDLPSFVPDEAVLFSAVSAVVSAVFPDGVSNDDEVLLSLSVWSYRVLFPAHPVGDWAGTSDTPPASQMPHLFGVPAWYRECDMGLFWSDDNDSIEVSVRDSRHDAVSLLSGGSILAEVFVPPSVVSADPSTVVVFDGLRKSGLDHLDACAALALLL